MKRAEYERLMKEACPHGPEEPCACNGYVNGDPAQGKCTCFPGGIVGCTCDIAWDSLADLKHAWIED